MNLEELVEHVREYYLRDTETPYLWPAKELVRYFNDAERIFARRTHCIVDGTSELTLLTTNVQNDRYSLDPRTIYVYEVYDTYGRRLTRWSRQSRPKSIHKGRPLSFTQDTGIASIRFSPAPDGEYEFSMLVARLPLKDMCETYDVPEIPEEYHLALCDYVAYMAVRNNDTESSETQAGANFREDWELKLRDAKRDAYHNRIGSNSRVVNNWVLGG
jgi:hypothetical protein